MNKKKVIGYDGINDNVIAYVYDSIKLILFDFLKIFLEEAAFSEKLKTAKLFIPVYKKVKK